MAFISIFKSEPGLIPKEAIICLIQNMSVDKKIKKNLLKVNFRYKC